MATQYANGKIVTNGLVLALDAADRNSYISGSTVWNDVSGNGNNGTLTNGPTFSNNSIVFDGVNDYVNIVPPNVIGSQISISLWYYKTAAVASATICAFNSNSGREFNCHIPWSDSIVYWDCGNNGNNDSVANFDRTSKLASLSDYNGWHNWVFWKNSTTGIMKIYRDGQEWHSDTGKTKLIGATINTNMGRFPSSLYYDNGRISSVQIYNRALSAQEVLQNYNAQKSRFGL